MKTDATYMGSVIRVAGALVDVHLSSDVHSNSPIVHGRVYRLGQIGSFVRIPLGFLNVYGIVSQVGAVAGEEAEGTEIGPARGVKTLQVQLIGEAYRSEPFQRGLSRYPTLDDEVHVVTEDDLAVIYGHTTSCPIAIGTHSASENLPAVLDLDKLVTRHSAILGSTGSGKSNAVAAILRSLTDGPYPNAQVVVIDPHGEYGSAFEGRSRVFRINDTTYPLFLPYWALSFDELAWFLVDRKSASESQPDSNLRDQIFDMRRASAAGVRANKDATPPLTADEITVDSPVPFDIRKLWHQLDRGQRVTYSDMGRTKEELVSEGDPAKLRAASFNPPGPGSTPPFKPSVLPIMGQYASKILSRLKDRRFDFLLSPGTYDGVTLDLHDLVAEWLNHPSPITVFDLAGVPPEVTDVVVGLLTRLIYEVMFWGRQLGGLGKQRPVLLVCEEAHSYLPSGEAKFVSGYARRAFQRVLKEGRKYGVGAMLVSQRPSELDETILSQCGTFIALRLSNSNDQGKVKSTVPDDLAGLTQLLPALRTGEALVLGEAIEIPSRVRIPRIEPRPSSGDARVADQWRSDRVALPDYAGAITAWRRQTPAQPKPATNEA